jgi:hypothetical protein
MPTLLAIEALEQDRIFVEQQLAKPSDDTWGTAKLMWQSRLTDIEAQINATASIRSNFASVALIFDGNPVIGTSDIRLDFTTDALDNYQKIIAIALASKMSEALPERGPLPGAVQSRLYIRDLVRGSMGFILEEIAPEQSSLLPSALKVAVEDATQLITTLSASSDPDFETALEATQPRLVGAVQRFAKVLYEAGASAKIVGDEHRLALTIDQVGQLSRRLNEIEVTEETESVDGVLLGVLPESHRFELKLPGDESITLRGAVSDDLAVKYTLDTAFKDQLLLKPVRAQVRTVRTVRSGKLVNEKKILEALEPAPAGGEISS